MEPKKFFTQPRDEQEWQRCLKISLGLKSMNTNHENKGFALRIDQFPKDMNTNHEVGAR